MTEVEIGKECKAEDLAREGFRRTKRMSGARFPENTFRFENDNEIYLVHEKGDLAGTVQPLAYYNLGTGEIRRSYCPEHGNRH